MDARDHNQLLLPVSAVPWQHLTIATGSKVSKMSPFKWLILCSVATLSIAGAVARPASEAKDDVFDHWVKLTNLYSSYSFAWKDQLAHLIRSVVNESKEAVAFDCSTALNELANQLEIGSHDALAMVDAFSKSIPGHMDGHIINFGHADSCNEIKMANFNGKHSLLQVQVPVANGHHVRQFFEYNSPHGLLKYPRMYGDRTIWFGVCLPSTCSSTDIDHLLQSSPMTNLTQPVKLKVDTGYVNTSKTYQLTKLACVILIVTVITLNVIGSSNLINSPLLKPFDISTNLSFLVTPSSTKTTQFAPLIKTYYTLASTFTHLILPIMYFQASYTQKPLARAIVNPRISYAAQYLVPNISFNFLIAAILSTWTWIPIMKSRKVPLTMFIIIRVLRTLPVQLFIMGMIILLPEVKLFGSLTDFANQNMSGVCFENGWADLIYISNLRPLRTKCNRVCWFLSAEMQLYCFSFFLLIYLSKKMKDGQRVNVRKVFAILIIFGLIINSLLYEPIATMAHLMKEPYKLAANPDVYIDFYMHTFNYVTPYVVGIYLGFELLQGTRIPEEHLKSSYTLSLATMALSILGPYYVLSTYYDHLSKLAIVLIAHFQLVTNTAAWSIFIMSYASSDNWLVDWLSNNIVTTLVTKLSFTYYLIHPFVVVDLAASLDIIFDSLIHMFISLVPGIFAFSIPLALFVHLFVEVPFGRLLKLLVSGSKKEKQL